MEFAMSDTAENIELFRACESKEAVNALWKGIFADFKALDSARKTALRDLNDKAMGALSVGDTVEFTNRKKVIRGKIIKKQVKNVIVETDTHHWTVKAINLTKIE